MPKTWGNIKTNKTTSDAAATEMKETGMTITSSTPLYSSNPITRKKSSWMSNPWFRLYSEFASDPKVQSMPEVMQRRLVMLLCLRCANVLGQLTTTELAYALSINTKELEKTNQLFQEKGFIDENWLLLNWNKRQFISDTNSNGAERARRYRARKKEQKNDGEGQTAQAKPAKKPVSATKASITAATRLHHTQVKQTSQPHKQSTDAETNTEADTDADADKKVKVKPLESPKAPTQTKQSPRLLLTVKDLTQDGLSKQAAIELLERRKQRNAPLTPLAWQAFIKEGKKINWEIEEVVQECLARGWQSFKAEWVLNSQGHKNNLNRAFSNTTNKQIEQENRNAQVAKEWLEQQGIQ